jgi:hypothetical protein
LMRCRRRRQMFVCNKRIVHLLQLLQFLEDKQQVKSSRTDKQKTAGREGGNWLLLHGRERGNRVLLRLLLPPPPLLLINSCVHECVCATD